MKLKKLLAVFISCMLIINMGSSTYALEKTSTEDQQITGIIESNSQDNKNTKASTFNMVKDEQKSFTFTQKNPSSSLYKWMVSDESVLEIVSAEQSVISVNGIIQSASYTVTVKALKTGCSNLYIVDGNGNTRATSEVYVTTPVTGVKLSDSYKKMSINDTHNLGYNLLPLDADNKNVKFDSSDKTVATVDEYGKITALNVGTTNISITTEDGGYTDICKVDVVIPVEKITLDKDNIVLPERNKSEKLNAQITPDDATEKTVNWTSSNKSVAVVDEDGLVTGINPGTCIITASIGDIKAECSVTVKSNEKPVINAEDVVLRVEDKFDYLLGVTAFDYEDGDITSKIKVIENTVDITKEGKYKVVYSVEDSNGNIVIKEISVTVIPKILVMNNAPTIEADDVYLKVGDIFYVKSGVSASDKEDGNLTSKIEVIENTVDTTKAGEYKVVYKVTDSQGASNTKTVKVVVKSNEKPVIIAKDITINLGDKFDIMLGISASDKEDGDITSKIKIVENTVNTLKSGKYKVVYSVTDSDTNVVTIERIVTVTAQKIENVKAASSSYNSNKITWKKVSGVNGYVVYRSTSKNGTYKVIKTITNGNTLSYTNSSLATGTTYYYKVRAYRTVDGKKVYSNYSSIVSAKPVLSKPSVTLTAGTKKATVKWKKISGASGYEVYRSTSKNGKYTNVKTITKGSTVSFTNSSLTKKKTYYYKVRAYRLVNGKKVYSSYSSIKSVKVK